MRMEAYEQDTREPHRRSLLGARVTPAILLLVVGLIAVFRLWIVETAYVEGRSMLDTLQPGDRVLVLKMMKPKRFDIVLVQAAKRGGVDIKRIVGMPGDAISMVPHTRTLGPFYARFVYGGQVYIDGIPYDESYATGMAPSSVPPLKLLENQYFVLGDNRDESTDSRRYGPVSAEDIRGVAVAVVYPFDRIGWLGQNVQVTPTTTASIPH